MNQPFRTLTRSAAVGMVATGLDFLALVVLVTCFGVPPRVASLPALLLGVGAQFVGNKWLAFRDASPDWARQAVCFAAIEALGLVCNAVLFDRLLVHSHLPYVVCRALSTSLVYFCVCLPLWSRLFSTTRSDELDAR